MAVASRNFIPIAARDPTPDEIVVATKDVLAHIFELREPLTGARVAAGIRTALGGFDVWKSGHATLVTRVMASTVEALVAAAARGVDLSPSVTIAPIKRARAARAQPTTEDPVAAPTAARPRSTGAPRGAAVLHFVAEMLRDFSRDDTTSRLPMLEQRKLAFARWRSLSLSEKAEWRSRAANAALLSGPGGVAPSPPRTVIAGMDAAALLEGLGAPPVARRQRAPRRAKVPPAGPAMDDDGFVVSDVSDSSASRGRRRGRRGAGGSRSGSGGSVHAGSVAVSDEDIASSTDSDSSAGSATGAARKPQRRAKHTTIPKRATRARAAAASPAPSDDGANVDDDDDNLGYSRAPASARPPPLAPDAEAHDDESDFSMDDDDDDGAWGEPTSYPAHPAIKTPTYRGRTRTPAAADGAAAVLRSVGRRAVAALLRGAADGAVDVADNVHTTETWAEGDGADDMMGLSQLQTQTAATQGAVAATQPLPSQATLPRLDDDSDDA